MHLHNDGTLPASHVLRKYRFAMHNCITAEPSLISMYVRKSYVPQHLIKSYHPQSSACPICALVSPAPQQDMHLTSCSKSEAPHLQIMKCPHSASCHCCSNSPADGSWTTFGCTRAAVPSSSHLEACKLCAYACWGCSPLTPRSAPPPHQS